jgi:hypothetical protein
MTKFTTLLTGIPRSGTTLSCKLLNNLSDVIALHEPIQPVTLPIKNSLSHLNNRLLKIREEIEQKQEVESGDKDSLDITNPVGDEVVNGVRQVIAQRGLVKIEKPVNHSFHLVVKQNAMFTALLADIIEIYPIVSVVRNPVDVLLSWLTVDLPINRGRVPGGERFDTVLRAELDTLPNRIDRQWSIYNWFVQGFLNAKTKGLVIVRYEDIILSQGACLQEVFSDKATPLEPNTPLVTPRRTFSSSTLYELSTLKKDMLNADYGGLYTQEDILVAFEKYEL